MDWKKKGTYTRQRLYKEIQELEVSYEYYEQSLENALNLMCKVARGEQTPDGMGEWVSLNYPWMRDKLPERLRVKHPIRKK